MKIRRSAIIAMILSAASAMSCTKENLESIYSNQEKSIDTFVNNLTQKDSSITTTVNNGSNRVTLVQGNGNALEKGGTVSFYYAAYTFRGGVSDGDMFATNSEDVAKGMGWEISDGKYEILTMTLGEDGMTDGLRNGLEGVRGGEECYIIFTGKYGFGKKAVGTIPANSALLYHIWVQSISND